MLKFLKMYKYVCQTRSIVTIRYTSHKWNSAVILLENDTSLPLESRLIGSDNWTVERTPDFWIKLSVDFRTSSDHYTKGLFNTLRQRQMDAISQTTFSNAFPWMKMFEFRLKFHKFLPKGPVNNIVAMVQIMAWRRPGDKPLSEPMMISLPTHICVARPQWVNGPEDH